MVFHDPDYGLAPGPLGCEDNTPANIIDDDDSLGDGFNVDIDSPATVCATLPQANA